MQPLLPSAAPQGFEENQIICIETTPPGLGWLQGHCFPLQRSVSCHGLAIYIKPPADAPWPEEFAKLFEAAGVEPRLYIEPWERHVAAARDSSGADWIYREH
jgi:hypothetical protein